MSVCAESQILLEYVLAGISYGQRKAWLNGQNVLVHPEVSMDMRKAMDAFYAQGGHVITWFDETYPFLLRQIAQPPHVLFALGDLCYLSGFHFAIIGTRNPSRYGEEMAHIFSEELASEVILVSGLALGIDGIVHRVSCDLGMPNIGILACGLDRIYPAKHQALGRRIKDKGLLLSEYPPGTLPLPYHFPLRNRLISGLCRGVLVIEARKKSGSLITARTAAQQGREVFCVPGNLDQPRSYGCNALIAEGAKLVLGKKSITEEFSDWPYAHGKNLLQQLTNQEKRVYDMLLTGPMRVATCLHMLNMQEAELYPILMHLEILGLITEIAPRIYQVIL